MSWSRKCSCCFPATFIILAWPWTLIGWTKAPSISSCVTKSNLNGKLKLRMKLWWNLMQSTCRLILSIFLLAFQISFHPNANDHLKVRWLRWQVTLGLLLPWMRIRVMAPVINVLTYDAGLNRLLQKTFEFCLHIELAIHAISPCNKWYYWISLRCRSAP